MNLTEHFTIEEMTTSNTATVRSIDNTHTIAAKLTTLRATLEQVRSFLGFSKDIVGSIILSPSIFYGERAWKSLI